MPDTVLAIVSRAKLNGMLTAFHRAGYGSVIRVLDPERAPVIDQLQRAGVQAKFANACPAGAVLVFVHAPKRTSDAAAIAVAAGAMDVELSVRTIGISDAPLAGMVQTATNRRSRRYDDIQHANPAWLEQPNVAD